MCPLKPVPSGDPGVQNECLGSGHLGRALPSVTQFCFLNHKPNQAGNQMVAQLGFVAGVWSSVKYPTIQHSVITPQLAVTHSLTAELIILREKKKTLKFSHL